MINNDKFNLKSFISPDAAYAPVYIWVWNDVCTREIIDEGKTVLVQRSANKSSISSAFSIDAKSSKSSLTIFSVIFSGAI